MPPIAASRKFDIISVALGAAEERGSISLTDAATLVGVPVEQLRELLTPILYLEFRDGNGDIIDQSRAFNLDEDDVLHMESGNWLRDITSSAPSSEGMLRLYIAATVFQATSPETSFPLDRALEKLRQAIAIDMAVPTNRPPSTDTAEQARTLRRSLQFRYVKWKDDVATDREVLPYDVFGNWGHWYVSGPEVDSIDTIKQWRIDRMQDVTVGIKPFEEPASVPDRGWFDLSEHLRVVVVMVSESRLASLPRPHRIRYRETAPDGRVRAEIEVSGDRHLDHLLVALGPDGEVVEPAEYRQRRRVRAQTLLEHVDRG